METPRTLQIMALREILNHSDSISYCESGDEVYFTFDGHTAFALPRKDVCIDLSKVRKSDKLANFFVVSERDQPLKVSRGSQRAGSYALVRLEADSFDVLLDKRLFNRHYKDQYLYAANPEDAVKLVSRGTWKTEAVIMPVKKQQGESKC